MRSYCDLIILLASLQLLIRCLLSNLAPWPLEHAVLLDPLRSVEGQFSVIATHDAHGCLVWILLGIIFFLGY